MLLPERIHLIGIGGIGLSAIARVLVMRGHSVSGSDARSSAITDELAREGVRITIGHCEGSVAGAELVLVSSAVPAENVEVQESVRRGIPVLDRRAFLAPLLAGNRVIAVAGTHGKTTTSGMIVCALRKAGYDPGFIVGGVLQDLGTNAQAGSGEWFVIEADEYGRMFHGLNPEIAVITTIEMDHPDCYSGIDDMRSAYGEFVGRIRPGGALVACIDGPQVQRLLDEQGLEALGYGLASQAEYRVDNVVPNSRGGVDLRVDRGGCSWAECSLYLPGVHNALNAAAALIVAEQCGIEPLVAGQALSQYKGVRRRFEVKGEAWGVTVVDDYGHHPTEIAATLAAARLRYGHRRIWAVVQPHTFSRLQALWEGFRTCLADADAVIVTDVYAARSREVHGANDAAALVQAIDHPAVRHVAESRSVEASLLEDLRPGDVLLTLGAGDGYLIGEHVLDALKERTQ